MRVSTGWTVLAVINTSWQLFFGDPSQYLVHGFTTFACVLFFYLSSICERLANSGD